MKRAQKNPIQSGRTLYYTAGDKVLVLFSKSALKNSGRGIVWIVDAATASRQPSNRHPWVVTVIESNGLSVWTYKMSCHRKPYYRNVIVGDFSNVAGVLV